MKKIIITLPNETRKALRICFGLNPDLRVDCKNITCEKYGEIGDFIRFHLYELVGFQKAHSVQVDLPGWNDYTSDDWDVYDRMIKNMVYQVIH